MPSILSGLKGHIDQEMRGGLPERQWAAPTSRSGLPTLPVRKMS